MKFEFWVAHLRYNDGAESELQFQARGRDEAAAIKHAERHMESTGGGIVVSIKKKAETLD